MDINVLRKMAQHLEALLEIIRKELKPKTETLPGMAEKSVMKWLQARLWNDALVGNSDYVLKTQVVTEYVATLPRPRGRDIRRQNTIRILKRMEARGALTVFEDGMISLSESEVEKIKAAQ